MFFRKFNNIITLDSNRMISKIGNLINKSITHRIPINIEGCPPEIIRKALYKAGYILDNGDNIYFKPVSHKYIIKFSNGYDKHYRVYGDSFNGSARIERVYYNE